ncbi:hypothetical protein COU54_04035 [Candidatus Pacearchaeota archaeon CG10_big_fil_rev_8_21_14_0_10_31_24]|nr:MAG: hypothetical protein COU54_04035 [Candidatus Pacearchaeota archaeon CG10_big_fil_rev_8_21_14_0_10_31_24]
MIYIDTNVFIYSLIGDDEISDFCVSVIKDIVNEKMSVCTSFLTWDEILYVLKKKIGREKALEETRAFINIPNLIFIPVDRAVISKAQNLSENYNLNPRDAIHAATAIINRCESILSDDSDFDKVKELKRKLLK